MPKNAILGRDLFTGDLKEPGDRTKEEVLSISDPKKPAKPVAEEEDLRPVAVTPAEQLTSEAEAAAAAKPAETPVVPLLKDN